MTSLHEVRARRVVHDSSRTAWLAALALGLAACGGGTPPAAPTAPVAAVPPAATTAPAEPVAAAPKSVDETLKLASAAVGENRLVSPAGNNAIEYYLAVMAAEPNNVKASQALVDIFPLVASNAEREVAQRNVAEAERIVGLLDRANPGSYTVTTLKNKLEQVRTAVQRDDAAKLAAEQQKVLAAQQAAQAAAQAAAGALPVEPAATPTPTASTTKPKPTPATATGTPPPTAAVTPPPPPVVEPPKPSGETRDARIVRQVQPQFPTEAVRKRESGWVEVEFVVGADGRVKSASVVRSQPARLFDKEALKAVQQWTFEAALQNGQAVESRMQRRLEFQLN